MIAARLLARSLMGCFSWMVIWTLALHPCGAQASGRVSLEHSSLPSSLPSSVRSDVIAFFHDWQQGLDPLFPKAGSDASDQLPTSFVSAESSSSIHAVVTNSVLFRRFKKYDVWFMQQEQGGLERTVATVGIFMDMTRKPPLAYYFELARDLSDQFGSPRFKPLSAQCYACHASGPRYLRPGIYAGRGKLSKDKWDRIGRLNDQILKYGFVETYISPDDAGYPSGNVAFHGLAAWKPLHAPPGKNCQDCHSAVTGIRAPLLQQHIATARYLEHHGSDQHGYTVPVEQKKEQILQSGTAVQAAMPPQEEKGRQGSRIVSMNRDFQEVHRTEAKSSPLMIRFATSFGSFEVKQIGLNGRAFCSGEICQGKLVLDFGKATTGIGLRDRHMHAQFLGSEQERRAEIDIHCPVSVKSHQGAAPCKGSVRWRGKSVPVAVAAAIHSVPGGFEVSSVEAKSTLSAFGVEPPRFLSAVVQDGFEFATAAGSTVFIQRVDSL